MLMTKWSLKRQRNGIDSGVVLMSGEQRLAALHAHATRCIEAESY